MATDDYSRVREAILEGDAEQAVVLGQEVAESSQDVMGAVDARRAGVASGVNNAVSRTAGLLSIAVMGILILLSFNTRLDTKLEAMGATEDVYELMQGERVKMAGAIVPDTLADGTAAAIRAAIAESYVDSFRRVMLAAACLSLVGGVVSAFTISGEKKAD